MPLEIYHVGEVVVSKHYQPLEPAFWECESVFLNDTLKIKKIPKNQGHYIEHIIWQTGHPNKKESILDVRSNSGELKEIEGVLPLIADYIAHARAINYAKGFGDEIHYSSRSLGDLLGKIFDQVQNISNTSFYMGTLQKIANQDVIP